MATRRNQRNGSSRGANLNKPWHQLNQTEICTNLDTHLTGLTQEEARERLHAVGPNVLKEAEATPLWKRFIAQFQDFMILVLLAATGVSAFLGEIADAVTIMAIVLLNAILGFIQEYRAEKSLDALKKLSAPEARVLRNGQEIRVPSDKVVPGDMVLLEAGDRVPADIRLTGVSELEIDESALTGESMPVPKNTGVLSAVGIGVGDMDNMAFSGTIVTRGRGRGLAVATGMQTEMGHIAHLIDTVQDETTPLQRRLEHLGKILVGLCLVVCAVVVLIGLWQGEPLYRMILTGVSLAVAAIPEGLPAIVTISLAIGVQKMIRSNAIIRKLPAVETLGCATAICSDKTGTLTQNQMTVRQIYFSGEYVTVGGRGYEPKGEFVADRRTVGLNKGGGTDWQDLNDLLLTGLLCNNADYIDPVKTTTISKVRQGLGLKPVGSSKNCGEESVYSIQGDPTEGALVVMAAKAGIRRHNVENDFTRIREIPFDSDRKRMAVVVRDQAGQTRSYVKGAPEAVIESCSFVRINGVNVPLDAEEKRKILSVNEAMGKSALRVLGLAHREMPARLPDEDLVAQAEEQLVFLGLVGMMDPPRPGVKQAVERCSKAGIRTVMITGDHPITAFAVARELGISERTDEVVSGSQLDEMDERELAERAPRVSVFARVSPAHKLRIVRAFKARGHVVAMTGDGVNDAPAVKEADIGVAMGRTGTDVTKEASAMVLADDNFVTIVSAVEEGRAIYDNIRKFIRYLLSCNTGEVLVMFLASLLALPLPLLPIQLLWVNLVTDGLPAMALSMERPDRDVMNRPPRHPDESILAGGLGKRILIWGTYCGLATLLAFAWGIYLGDLPLARTMAFCTLTFFQLFYVFGCRSDRYSVFELGWGSNLYLIGAVFISASMQLAVVYLPPLQKIFQTVPLEASHWIVVLFMAGGWLVVSGLWHLVNRPMGQRQHPIFGRS